jgi:cell wall-associated NlpC family hydrolase
VRARLTVAAVLCTALVVSTAAPSMADTVNDKRREAQRVANQLEQLEERGNVLAEAYNEAVFDLEEAKASVSEAERQVATLDGELGGLKANLASFALRSYVYAGQSSGLASLLSGESIVDESAQRQGYAAIALGSNLDVSDDVAAKLQDSQRARDVLQYRKTKAEQLTKKVAATREQVEQATEETEQLLVRVQGELAQAVREEQERRAAAAAAAARAALARAEAEARAAAEAAAARAAAARPTPARGTRGVRSTRAAEIVAAPVGPVGGPARHPGADVVVRAALSQLGVPYRFAQARPGRGMDCSGLTMWAWSTVGVGMPHLARRQVAMFPRVRLADIAPGDLVWYPGHIVMYVGNGMVIQAPRTGDVVKLTPLRTGRRNLVIARPR